MNETPAKIEVIETQSPQGTQTEAKAAEGVTEAPAGPIPGPEGLEAAEKAAVAREIEVRLQPIMLDASIGMIGNLLQNFTKMDQMNFNKAEHDALVAAWTPLLPLVSPWTNAILITLIVLGGKGLYYNANRTKAKPKPESKESDRASAPEGEPRPEGAAIKPTE